MELSIIIVNYKTANLTVNCIDSIKLSQIEFDYEIIVVDNYSCDDSEEMIVAAHPDIRWIQNTYNAGFGRGNNLGVENAEGEYILLVNSDLTVKPDSIATCFNHLIANFEVGIVSCQILYPDGRPQNFTSTVASYKKILERNLLIDYFFIKGFDYKIEAVMGSFMMFQAKRFIQVGKFDPDFFMYSEEIELCHRFSQRGFSIVLVDSTSVFHLNGGSSSAKDWATKQSYLSSALLFLKVRGYGGYLVYQLLIKLNYITNFFLMWFVGKDYRKSFWRDIRCYFSNWWIYILIPLMFSKNTGKGKRQLKIEN